MLSSKNVAITYSSTQNQFCKPVKSLLKGFVIHPVESASQGITAISGLMAQTALMFYVR